MTDGLSDIDHRSELFQGLTRENLASVTAEWPRTRTTPPAVADLLAESRRLFVGAAHAYDNFVASALKALHAADLALKLKLGLPAGDRRTLGKLIEFEREERPVLSPPLREWYTTPVLKTRNWLSHPKASTAFTPGLSAEILVSVHAAVEEMFPDAESPDGSQAVDLHRGWEACR